MWYQPSFNSDIDDLSKWSDEVLAYDGNLDTFATTNTNNARLAFVCPDYTEVTQIRIKGQRVFGDILNVNVDVWLEVEGFVRVLTAVALTVGQYTVFKIPKLSILAISIECCNISEDVAHIYEIEIGYESSTNSFRMMDYLKSWYKLWTAAKMGKFIDRVLSY